MNLSEEQEEMNPSEEQKVMNLSEEQKEMNPSEEQKEMNPSEEQKEMNPSEEQKEMNPSEEQKEMNLIEEQKEMNPSEEQKEMNPSEEQKEMNPSEEQKEMNPSEEQKEMNPNEEQERTYPSEEIDGIEIETRVIEIETMLADSTEDRFYPHHESSSSTPDNYNPDYCFDDEVDTDDEVPADLNSDPDYWFDGEVDMDDEVPADPDSSEQRQVSTPADNCTDQCTTLRKPPTKPGYKQSYDKFNYCTFCQKLIKSKISRHILTVHKDERRVYDILFLGKRSKERMRRLNLLANEGNYKHNIEALKNGRCDIIVARRHGVDKALKENEHLDFIPCEHCLKFVKKYHIWHHLRNCHEVQAESPDDQVLKNALRKGRSLLSSSLLNEAPQAESLLARMHNGPVKQCAQTDSLIMRYASLRIEALGGKVDQKPNDMYRVSQGVRTLARVLLEMRRTSPARHTSTALSMTKALTPPYFDLLVSSTKQLAFSEVSPALNLAKKIGNLIGHLIVIKLGFELRKTPFDNAAYEATIRFQRIFDAEWRHRINAPATRKLQTANREKVAVIPLTEDLVTLNKHFIKTMKECFIALQQLPDMSTWQKMSRYTMCRLLIFNKRRRAEVKDMLVQSYLKRPKWADDSNQEIRMALSDLDKLLVQRMDLYVARGKSVKNNDAFILLPPDCRQALDLLIKTREVVGISKDNPFIFARQFANSALSGNNELSELAQQCPGIKEPQRISSTALRKYTATVSQVMDLKGSELGMLARHLGHDPKTHKEYYRLTSSTVELSKVSKLLLALEKGEVNQWRGRRLEDITLDELPDVYDDDEEQDGLELDADPASACCQLDEQSMQLPDAYNEDEEHDSTQSTHDNDGLETDAHHSDSCQLDEQMEPDKRQQPMKAKCARYKWSVGETDILMKEYESFINLPSGNRLPGKATVLAFIARVGWKNIPYYTIRNKLANMQRLKREKP